MTRSFLRYLGLSLAFCFAAAFVGSVFTFGAVRDWYPSLIKPSFTPPSWVFGPAWTVLYTLMAVSCALVWNTKTKKKEKKEGLAMFSVQLVFNALWSVVFFGLRQPCIAFGIIVSLWIFIALTVLRFSRVNRASSLLLLPYLAWVSFAAALNYFVAILN